jgi:hypothetical protein
MSTPAATAVLIQIQTLQYFDLRASGGARRLDTV